MIKSFLHVFRLLAVLFLVLPFSPLRAVPAVPTSAERLTNRHEGSGLDAPLVHGPTVFLADWLQHQNRPANGRANATTDEWNFGVSYLLRGNDLKLSLNYISGQQPAPLPRGDLFLTRVQVIF